MNRCIHIELTTEDLGRAKSFYKKIFDWKLRDSVGAGAPPYTLVDWGEKDAGGGMQNKPMPSAPTGWMPYIEVASVKKTVAKAKKAGAKILLEYMEIGAHGAIGIFVDPTGAHLGVWEMPKAAPKKASARKKAAARKAAAPARAKKAAAPKKPGKKPKK